jgi:IS5 family transposase
MEPVEKHARARSEDRKNPLVLTPLLNAALALPGDQFVSESRKSRLCHWSDKMTAYKCREKPPALSRKSGSKREVTQNHAEQNKSWSVVCCSNVREAFRFHHQQVAMRFLHLFFELSLCSHSQQKKATERCLSVA